MKKLTTKAIVLRRVNYGEADRILTVITPHYGKVSLFAKGARRSKSKLAGGLELFCIADIDFVDSQKDLKTIISARLDQNFTDVVSDVNATMLAYDFIKTIDQQTQDSCDEQFFTILASALESLSRQEYAGVVKAWFYVQVLMNSGLAINLESQSDGAPFEEDTAYTFDFDTMGFVAAKVGQFTPQHIKFLRLLGKINAPGHLLRVDHSKDLADDVVGLLEQCTKSIT